MDSVVDKGQKMSEGHSEDEDRNLTSRMPLTTKRWS